jgi:hypothetical protein
VASSKRAEPNNHRAMMNADAHFDTDSAIRRLRWKRRRVVQRRRRARRLMIGGAAIASALSTALVVASFTGTDLAGAAATRARDVMDLIDQRSPGARTEAQLTKMRRMAPPEEFPAVRLPVNLAEVIAPPPAYVPVEVEPKAPELLFMTPSAPGAIFMTPPGGGGGSPPGGGGGPPGGGGGPPPGSPPLVVTPAVPEPGTWMTMLMGFGFIGWSMRRQRAVARAAA